MARTVAKETTLHGRRLRPGQGVLFLYASAGRDEREFDDPDTFDIHRNPARTISFGTGPHMCTGRGFGTLQGEILSRILLERMPEYVIDDSNLEVIKTEYMRGWVTLPASVS